MTTQTNNIAEQATTVATVELKTHAKLAKPHETKWVDVIVGYDYDDVFAFWFYKNEKKYAFFIFEADLCEPILVVRSYDMMVVASIPRRLSQMRRVYADVHLKMKNSNGETTIAQLGVRE